MLHDAIAAMDNSDFVLQECVGMYLAKSICPPEEVAALIGFLTSDRAGSIFGQACRIDSGLGIQIGGN